MTEKKKNLSEFTPFEFSSAQNTRIGIVVSEWNDRITDSLLNGAEESLLEHGILQENILVKHVPGSFELPLGAKWMLEKTDVDAVICIGCIIQGETRHFDFIAQAVADGIMNVGLQFSKPVIFSVLTCNTMEQAEDRSGGKHGNKGVEGAVSALKMLSFGN
ncbi:MAG: 6,7-dimethyl-8-ribityllumazine synthase [Bacteroidales bacterium]|jgi:6,7-dimethyl-8-ribityllumazine synthase|nr:6,7-dimethyl-8-ribityllumazine synthase [Bacteroidales bacterium]MBR3551660.1 6,7-dimethyl-8-ribityllumazine synthase [Bacteroidales bacterium]MBR4638222.1 6,7-dimethyl-8-ribityllumazine synthase [Bacteroidales bacterium]MBR5920812.1 6,7-dimethyl-8-ribityllumazine synthase [Bacteroidales bacterium]MBR6175137.1 6,7-dimethyl-8-ribityllumazine synthase [Bacteroidales bacterium]